MDKLIPVLVPLLVKSIGDYIKDHPEVVENVISEIAKAANCPQLPNLADLVKQALAPAPKPVTPPKGSLTDIFGGLFGGR